MGFLEKIKTAIRNNARIDQEGLDLLKVGGAVNLRKCDTKSRLIVTSTGHVTSEIGIDLPGDTMEDMVVAGFTMATSSDGLTLGN